MKVMITYEISGRRYAEIIFKKVSIYMDFRVLQLSNYIYNIKGDDTMANTSITIRMDELYDEIEWQDYPIASALFCSMKSYMKQ